MSKSKVLRDIRFYHAGIEVRFDRNTGVVWVNAPDKCVLRVSGIPVGQTHVNDPSKSHMLDVTLPNIALPLEGAQR